MRLLPSSLLKMPPNLKMYWSLKGTAQLFAEGVLRGAMRRLLNVCRENASHSRVTYPSAENPPSRKMLLSK
jgi:hypothetical protein